MKPLKQEHNDIMRALEEHYASTQLTAKGLADILGTSESHLNNLCHTYYGKTPAKLIRCYRIEKALEYHATIGEKNFNCILVGFDNHRRYVTALKKYRKEYIEITP